MTTNSRAQSGLFRGYNMKLVIGHDLPVFMPTLDALEQAKDYAIGLILDENIGL